MRSELAWLAIASVVTLAACEQILGIDKYQKCDAPCDAATFETGALDGGSDVLQLPDGVSEASSWPRWRMENTPLEVEGGAPDASLSQFTPAGDGGVHDDVTGLNWNLSIGTANTVEAAAAYCQGLGWRLPTRIEIASLLDSTRGGSPYVTPTFDAALLDAGSPNALWTSSYYRPVTGPVHFWFAVLFTGDMLENSNTQAGVLCVK